MSTITLKESWNTAQTVVRIEQPGKYTGLERIMLAAQGDLQRLLSSFFADTIDIEVIYAKNTPRIAPAAPDAPIIQTRKVLLKCRSVVVCTATSTVTLTSPECERLILDEKFAIGQTFRQMKQVPAFLLKDIELNETPAGEEELRRTYTLTSPGIECEILEVFPSRDMFVYGEEWLAKQRLITSMRWSPETDGSSSGSE
ncbi:hypothetical protein F5879DRAFT_936302 [Lentinula edodes]|uniref:UbiC transcription regulator-associated domain-containing protein n=1 Tax=Lentinula edodes TaxID=5353 RepID=A0A1Q3DYH7_LENED|nr:uncharacterized protein C8R40DRAFT_1067483 [Lentinula edodes]KAF8831630.1 hypothetical protein HHX47_DHR1000522 [Lentinula edodes]KAH7877878.1 hypothetical protein C8R40DRAFT_1067483 [Lentinula edodes]KAJ3908677.1 hypothetical protein F5879DRAFT_936302 [Lentinula edodes]GAW00063.1 hypothetical protein LENED_001555 [Lentinula edodes]